MSSKAKSTSVENCAFDPVSVSPFEARDDAAASVLDLPPLLRARRPPEGAEPLGTAAHQAAEGRSEAGDLWWSADPAGIALALVLEPTVERERCYEMLPLMMVAFAEALGALAPPEVAVQHRWPATILVNGAAAARGKIALSEKDGPDGLPPWLAVGLEAALRSADNGPEPGHDVDRTTLADEGCGDLTGPQLIEVTARHVLSWLDAWEQEGFAPVHRQWCYAWADQGSEVRVDAPGGERRGRALGIDEHGGLLLKTDAGTVALALSEALEPGEVR